MKFTKKELLDFIAKASFLHERIKGDFIPSSMECEKNIDSYISRWKELSDDHDDMAFQRRLFLDNMDIDKIRPLLGKVTFTGKKDIPPWCGILKKIINRKPVSLKKLRKEKTYLCGNLPFDEFFVPFVMIAMDELARETGDSCHILTEKASVMLEYNLFYSLNMLCVKSVYQAFTGFLSEQEASPEHGKYYDHFIRKHLKNSFKDFFMTYPVLGRIVSTFIQLWEESVSEFFLRLKEDLPEISEIFYGGNDPGYITDLNAGLSDRHNGGRTVIAITFSSGLNIVYKPRNLSLDCSYMKLLSWFNERSGITDFKTFNILNRENYGWAEFVEYLPCKTGEEGKNYYRRTGHLLCLLYVLGSSDCHMENLIACGEYPVFVDLETLMEPEVRVFGEEKYFRRVRALADKEFFSSVIKTGILPRWTFEREKKPYDVSALGSIGDHGRPFLKETWKNLKTDSIKMDIEEAEFKQCRNVPSLDGTILYPFEYKEFILEGFRDFYTVLIKHRDDLLSSDSPLKELKNKYIRFFFRFTGDYGLMIKQVMEPSLLRDPLMWSITLDGLAHKKDGKHFRPVIKSEILSLEQLDIPSITCLSDRTDLYLEEGEKIENFFHSSGYDNVITRIKKLDLKDMERQSLLIYSSLCARNIIPSEDFEDYNFDEKTHHDNLLIGKKLHIADFRGPERSLDDDFLIGQRLKEHAISFCDAGVSWTCYKYVSTINRFQLEPADYSLHNGICGITLFMSALENIQKKGIYTETILSALKPVFTDLDDKDFSGLLLKEAGVEGIKSIVYTLNSISHFLDMPFIMDYAKKAGLLIKVKGEE
ncbi:MAG: type 2 lanthipeptide synthetase LanM [Candidatus Eremiobacterota bacterium]